jgi:hypothetical protein
MVRFRFHTSAARLISVPALQRPRSKEPRYVEDPVLPAAKGVLDDTAPQPHQLGRCARVLAPQRRLVPVPRDEVPRTGRAAGPAREPIEPISRLGRGVQLHGEKDFQQALQQLLVAARSDPNDPRVFVYLADTYGWLGMDAEAKQAAERAKQLDPNAFEILR